MTTRRSTTVSLLRGILVAACAAVFVEAVAQGLALQHSEFSISPVGRLIRCLEFAAFVALGSLVAGVVAAVVMGESRRQRYSLERLVSLCGVGLALWITIGFAMPALSPVSHVLSTDPITSRWPYALAGAVMAVLIVAAGWLSLKSDPARLTPLVAGGVAMLSVALLLLVPGGASREQERPDLILFSVDTLRADHLGCYGYRAEVSPTIDELCRESIVFERAIAPTSTTIPSYTSIMTGLLPRDHGVYTNYQRLAETVPLVAESMAEAGYLTAAVLEGSFPGTGGKLDRGFAFVSQRGIAAAVPVPSPAEALRSLRWGVRSLVLEGLQGLGAPPADWSVATEAALTWLAETEAEQPIFAHFYWNFPHQTYTPPHRYLEILDDAADGTPDPSDRVRLYDAEIRFTDEQVRRVLESLATRKRPAWVLFTADHGEELGREVVESDGTTDTFWGHSAYVYEPSVRVPLLIRPPAGSGFSPSRVDRPVSTASIAATLRRLAEVESAGPSLAALPLDGSGPATSVASVARTSEFDRVGLWSGQWHLIENRRPSQSVELYRIGDEGTDLSADRVEEVGSLLQQLRAFEPTEVSAETMAPAELSAEEHELLEQLGYVE